MSTVTIHSSQATLAGPVRSQAGPAHRWLLRLFDTLLSWQERARQRYDLQQLDDHMLRDLGLSRADVVAEITKPFWRP
jgi:uncharacterized protein YjiS (DUF1127 family)